MGLRPRHLLSHEQQQSSVTFFHAAEQAAELGKQSRLFARTSPSNVVGSFALREMRQLRRLFDVVEKPVQRHIKGTGEFLKRFDSGDSVPILHT